jgi:hypothetical protein
VSHQKICQPVRCSEKPRPARSFSMSMAASTMTMKPVCPAAVPAVWAMLASKRFEARLVARLTTLRIM